MRSRRRAAFIGHVRASRKAYANPLAHRERSIEHGRPFRPVQAAAAKRRIAPILDLRDLSPWPRASAGSGFVDDVPMRRTLGPAVTVSARLTGNRASPPSRPRSQKLRLGAWWSNRASRCAITGQSAQPSSPTRAIT